MINKISTVAVLVAAATLAQPAPGGRAPLTPEQAVARRVQHLTTLLSLTASQQTQITAVLTEERSAAEALRTNLQTAHTNLRNAIDSRAGDSQIDTAASQVGLVQGQLTAIHGKAQVKLLNILTPEQREKLAALPQFGRGGHGGPIGPGAAGAGMRHRGPGL
ncbi:MAG TPA: Spy/CpxP family protein refolding chaperone [Bryobacteraceae bacterium]|nr:Spy/CpxP family protein refolding chaperone [Bryobacteraceae bacterium]